MNTVRHILFTCSAGTVYQYGHGGGSYQTYIIVELARRLAFPSRKLEGGTVALWGTALLLDALGVTVFFSIPAGVGKALFCNASLIFFSNSSGCTGFEM